MKKYQEPQIEVEIFAVEDIVTTSEEDMKFIGDCL